MTRLAIIIVTYNSRKDLETALQSLTEPAPSVPHEIVVVDNASTDSTPAYIRERWPAVRLIASESNLGNSPHVRMEPSPSCNMTIVGECAGFSPISRYSSRMSPTDK